MSTLTSIRLDDAIKQDLDAFASQENRAKNWVINQALKDYLGKKSQQALIKKVQAECAIYNEQDKNDPFLAELELMGMETWDGE